MASKNGCISEDYVYPFRQDLPLIGYLKDHNQLVGREWLIQRLNRKLLSQNVHALRSHGLLIVAEFGYGKSAVISHLLCANDKETGQPLKKIIVAFHVCKFDVPSTKSPERFIRRLVGFLATKSAEYGSAITLLSNDSILFSRDNCGKEIEACFDQAITFPLKEVNITDETWLIVLDALDECYCPLGKTNAILELLISRLQYFPYYIKFLITSRYFGKLEELISRKIEMSVLRPDDTNNRNDIKLYITKILENTGKRFDSFAVGRFLNKTEGNFLYALHALQYVVEKHTSESDFPDLPETLEDIYEFNFDRQFNRGKSFETCKMILEVICSSLHPLTKEEIYTIARNESLINGSVQTFEKEFRRLNFFLNTKGTITIQHKAIHTWLLSEKNNRYRISTVSGHGLLSKVLLNSLIQNNTSINIVDLAIHLSESKNKSLMYIFENLNVRKLSSFKLKSILHDVIDTTSSSEALDLILKHHPNISTEDRKGMTPVFLAASKGHLEQVELLYRKGADLNAVVSGCWCLQSYDTVAGVSDIKKKHFTGYSPLHIAVQHKHIEVVQFLTRKANVSLNIRNAVGMRASDIACESGSLDILKVIHKQAPGVIDDACLYYATRSEKSEIVKYLSKNGVKGSCLRKKAARLEWKEINTPCRCSRHIRALDTWWIVTQESVLHVAVKNGFVDLAKFLIQKKRELLRCVNAFGYTTQVLVVKYARTELISHVFRSKHVDTCIGAAIHTQDFIQTTGYIDHSEDRHYCPKGANFAHLIALYDNQRMIEMLKEISFLDWNTRDSMGNLPVHYAACHSSAFLRFTVARYGRDILSERADNGSTVYHIAALCNEDKILREITNDYSNLSTDLKLATITDKDGRNVLHYSVLWDFNQNSWLGEKKAATSSKAFKFFLDHINVTEKDKLGNTVLHYVLLNGHFHILKILMQTYKDADMVQLALYLKNAEDLAPIEYALRYASSSEKDVSEDEIKLNLSELQTRKLDTFLAQSLWKSCMVVLFKILGQTDLQYLAERNTDVLFVRSPVLTKLLFKLLKVDQMPPVAVQIIRKLLISGMKMSKRLPTYTERKLSVNSLSSFTKVGFIHVCEMPINSSPFHFIVLNSLTLNCTSFVHRIINKMQNKTLLKCESAEGYNILHYSLIGGNIELAFRLKSKGVPIITGSVSATDILSLITSARFVAETDVFAKLDAFAADFINEKYELLKPGDFCKNGSLELSLIHLFIMNGMIRTVNVIEDRFGTDVLRCRNIDGFSCFYFAVFFKRLDIERYLKEKLRITTYEPPHCGAEESLVMNVINKFPSSRFSLFRILSDLSPFPLDSLFSIRQSIKTYQILDAFSFSEHTSQFLNDYIGFNFIYFRQGLHLFKEVLFSVKLLKTFTNTAPQVEQLDCQMYAQILSKLQATLLNLKYWCEMKHQVLSWTREYTFLKNMKQILELPEKFSLYLSYKNDSCFCPTGGYERMWNAMIYLDKVIKVFSSNFMNTYLLLNLLDQKSAVKFTAYPVDIDESIQIRLQCALGFSLINNVIGGLTPSAVYRVRRFRYLNRVKATTAYKEILAKWSIIGIHFRGSDRHTIAKKVNLIKSLIFNESKRMQWISKRFKCEMVKDEYSFWLSGLEESGKNDYEEDRSLMILYLLYH